MFFSKKKCRIYAVCGVSQTPIYNSKKEERFTGLYHRDNVNFFALYPSKNGPVIYYLGKEYALHQGLHITLDKKGKNREFRIKEYDIDIKYQASKYVGMDVWSKEEGVDLFYQIFISYKNEKYYKKFFL